MLCRNVLWSSGSSHCKYELNCEYCNITLARNKAPWWWSDKILNMSECFMWNYMCIRWLINWSDSTKNARCYNKISTVFCACHEDAWGSTGLARLILNLSIRCWWAVSLTRWPHYGWGKSYHYLPSVEPVWSFSSKVICLASAGNWTEVFRSRCLARGGGCGQLMRSPLAADCKGWQIGREHEQFKWEEHDFLRLTIV